MLGSPATPPRIPAYRLHEPTCQAVVTLSGKDYYLGRHGTPQSRKAYDTHLAEYLAARSRQTSFSRPPADLTIHELLLAFWEHVGMYYVKDGQPTSEPDTIRLALRPVRELYGDARAGDFGPLALKAVRQAMIERGWCRGCINKQVDRIKRMFAWAAENELLPVSHYQALKTVGGLHKDRSAAREKPPVGPVSDALIGQTRARLSPTVATIVRVQRLTGMRPQEIILMKGGEIDRPAPDFWVYRPGRHKAQHHQRERLIFLGRQSQELLTPFLDLAGTSYLFSPRRAEQQRRTAERAARKTPKKSPPPRRK